MNKIARLALLLFLCLLAAGCSRAQLTASWRDPGFDSGKLHSIVVLGVSKDAINRRTFEDEMTERLRQFGIDAEPGYRTVPGSALPEKEEVEEWIGQLQADGVLISRLVDSRTEKVVTPGRITYEETTPYYWRRSYRSRIDPYRGWYPYYRRSYEIIHEPARVSEFRVYTVETTLYDLATDAPVWSARAELVPDGDLNRLIEEFVSLVIDDMIERNVL